MALRLRSRLTWAPTLRREACASRFWPQASQVSGACSRSPLTRIGWLRQNPLAPSGLPGRRAPARSAGPFASPVWLSGEADVVSSRTLPVLPSVVGPRGDTGCRSKADANSFGSFGQTCVLRPRQRQKLARRRQQILMRQRRQVRRRQGFQIVCESVRRTRGKIAFATCASRKCQTRRPFAPTPSPFHPHQNRQPRWGGCERLRSNSSSGDMRFMPSGNFSVAVTDSCISPFSRRLKLADICSLCRSLAGL